MVAPAVVVAFLLLVATAGLVLVLSDLHRARQEAAYWDARATRTELYDWAEELDL